MGSNGRNTCKSKNSIMVRSIVNWWVFFHGAKCIRGNNIFYCRSYKLVIINTNNTHTRAIFTIFNQSNYRPCLLSAVWINGSSDVMPTTRLRREKKEICFHWTVIIVVFYYLIRGVSWGNSAYLQALKLRPCPNIWHPKFVLLLPPQIRLWLCKWW